MVTITNFLLGIISAIIAKRKGFKPLRWILALGIIGMITVICMSSAKSEGITPEEAEQRAAKANTVGAMMAWIYVSIGVFILILFLIA
jgi:hypothetical protein